VCLVDVSLTVSPIKDRDGRTIGASKILRDVSNQNRMEQSLLRAEKIAATWRMAATIAHEINNPLEALMNLLYLLREKITDELLANEDARTRLHQRNKHPTLATRDQSMVS
jgi:C4-dicarboxylate-specific signal transduction histidine kinase